MYGGGSSLGTADVNESILVTQNQGLTPGSYGGVGWVELGTFNSIDGNLEVVLSNLASGRYADADGVLVIPSATPDIELAEPTSSGIALGVLPPLTDDSSSPSRLTSAAASTASIVGVRKTTSVHMIYKQENEPKDARALALIDEALDTIDVFAKNRLSVRKRNHRTSILAPLYT